jgi:hypothetical protein
VRYGGKEFPLGDEARYKTIFYVVLVVAAVYLVIILGTSL